MTVHQRERSLGGYSVSAISGVVTKQQVSFSGIVYPEGSRACRLDIKVSGVTVVGSINAIAQHQTADLGWEDTKTVAITGNGVFSFKFDDAIAADQPYMPLRSQVRIVLTSTNAGDKATISSVILSQ